MPPERSGWPVVPVAVEPAVVADVAYSTPFVVRPDRVVILEVEIPVMRP